jgi:lipopolysaccharide transport system permease protein
LFIRKHYIDLVWYRAYVDLKSESAQSYLGFIWWILEPLLYLAAFYLIFELVMKRGGVGFVGFLLCGLVFWRWFDNSIKKMSGSIINNANLLSQVYVPKAIFPFIDFLSNIFRFLFVMLAFLGFIFLYQGQALSTWWFLALILLVQGVFIAGLGLILAAVVPLVPDLKKIIDNVLMLMFYLSGIFFDVSTVKGIYGELLLLNPMAVLLHSYRQVLLNGVSPDWLRLGGIAIAGLALLAIGFVLLTRFDKLYPRVLSR